MYLTSKINKLLFDFSKWNYFKLKGILNDQNTKVLKKFEG